MNQYDFLIHQYLEEQQTVTLEKIGTLNLTPTSSIDNLPSAANIIDFQFDKRAITSPGLIEFIAQKMQKNKNLVQSDLESYLELMRQVINIGKAYEIERIGTFRIGKFNEYGFTAFDFSQLTDQQKNSNKKADKQQNVPLLEKNTGNKQLLMLLALLIVLGVLGVIGWGSYTLLTANKAKEKDALQYVDTVAGTTTPVTTIQDTIRKLAIPSDTSTTSTIITDSANYRLIFETTTSAARASYRTAQLIKFGNKNTAYDSLRTDTGFIYHLYFKMKLNTSDTARARDSIQRFLQRRVRIVPVKD